MAHIVTGTEAQKMELSLLDFAKINQIPVDKVRTTKQTIGQRIYGCFFLFCNLGDYYETEVVIYTIGEVSMRVMKIVNEGWPSGDIEVQVEDGRRSIISGNKIETIRELRFALENEKSYLGINQGIKTKVSKKRVFKRLTQHIEKMRNRAS